MDAPAISVIIPAYNEEALLPGTLGHLFAQSGSFEVIVVDGASTDKTAAVARSFPAVRLLESPKGRALQMNRGALAARGRTLLFLHADTFLPSGGLERIAKLAEKVGPDRVAGAFRHAFLERRFVLMLVSLLDNMRCRVSRVPYGDQAIFVGRELFWRLGGFDEEALAEDLEFSTRLARAERVHLIWSPVRTSGRKFLAMGPWRALGRCLVICLRAGLGLDLSTQAQAFFKDIR